MSIQSSKNSTQEFEVNALSHPHMVALRFGRRLNETQHRIEMAWLNPSKLENQRVLALFQELRLLSRGLSSDELRRDAFAAAITKADDYWRNQFGSPWHADLQIAMERDLKIVEEGRTPFTGCQNQSEVFRDTLTSISSLAWGLPESLLRFIPSELCETICFGFRLDQILHGQFPHRFMRAFKVETPFYKLGWECDNGTSRHRSCYSIKLSMPEPEMDPDLIAELKIRWHQLGFPETEFRGKESKGAKNLVTRIENDLFQQMEGSQTRPEPPPPRYLGLYIDGQALRRGDRSVDVNGRQARMLVQRLLENGHRHTTRDELEADWETLGGHEPNPDSNTIRAQITRLRNLLRPLGVTIPRRSPGGGWRIEPIDET